MEQLKAASNSDRLHRSYEEACSTADVLAKRMLECMRAAQSVLQQRDRYRRHPNAIKARDVVEAVLAHVTLDTQTASCLIKALAKTDQAHLSRETADWLLETRPHMAGTHAVLHAAISAEATSCFKPDHALRYFHLIDSYGLPPCLEATNMAITACSHSGRVDDALTLLEGMAGQGLQPTTYSVIMTLQAANFKRQGRFKEGLRAIQCLPRELRQTGPVVDALLGVFEAAVRQAPDLDAVEKMFRELNEFQLADSTRAFNAVLKACAHRGQWQLARSYFDIMAQEDVPADSETFNALILSALKGQALGVALDIFEWLVSGREVSEPIPADIVTYNTLIKACHQAGLLEKALEIASWVLRTNMRWDAETYRELISTVEIAQLWDNKVVTSPFYQFTKFSEGVSKPAPVDQPKPVARTAEAVNSEAGNATPSQRLRQTGEMGSVSSTGHSGLSPTLEASIRLREGIATRGSAIGSQSLPVPELVRPETPPMLPLAIFPDQLRPAPFDGLRMVYLDQLKELQEESLLAAVKLRDSSWAARTLTRGGGGSTGKGPAPPTTTAAGALHGVGTFSYSTEGKATQPIIPKLPRLVPRPHPVDLSPAPSFRNMSLDTVSQHRLEVMNQAMLEGASPRKDPRTHNIITGDSMPMSPSKSPHKRTAYGGLTDENSMTGLASPARLRADSFFGSGPSFSSVSFATMHDAVGLSHLRPSDANSGVNGPMLPLPGVGHVTSTISGVHA